MVNDFVSKINAALRYQDEVEKVKLVSQRLATMCVIRDVPIGWEKVPNRFVKFHIFHFINLYSTYNLIYNWIC